jgi:hypothetical protein
MTTDLIFGYREAGIWFAALCMMLAPWEYPTIEKVWLGQALLWVVKRFTMSAMPCRPPVMIALLAGYYIIY